MLGFLSSWFGFGEQAANDGQQKDSQVPTDDVKDSDAELSDSNSEPEMFRNINDEVESLGEVSDYVHDSSSDEEEEEKEEEKESEDREFSSLDLSFLNECHTIPELELALQFLDEMERNVNECIESIRCSYIYYDALHSARIMELKKLI